MESGLLSGVLSGIPSIHSGLLSGVLSGIPSIHSGVTYIAGSDHGLQLLDPDGQT